MPVYGVPRDPSPHGLSFEAMVLDDPNYATGVFDAYMDMSRDYSTWFVESFAGPIIGDVPVSGVECWEASFAFRWPLEQSGEHVSRLQRPGCQSLRPYLLLERHVCNRRLLGR